MEAEKGLMQISKKFDIEVVIIRPPLVYGHKAPGNFRRIINLVKSKLSTPFGSIVNKRSFIGLSNLINFIILCIDHPKSCNEIFVLSDNQDVSLKEFLKLLSDSIGKKIYISFPHIFTICS